jgi:hypothetical protein
MTGIMPLKMEKGPLGLRMDFLARIEEARQGALDRIQGTPQQAAEDFWVVARSISAGGLEINLLDDDRNVFAAKLNELSSGLEKQASLRAWNRDSTGNRSRFVAFWEDQTGNTQLMEAIRGALITSLESAGELDVWWDGTRPANSGPGVAVSTELDEVTRLLFRTDRSPIVAETVDMEPRAPDL